MAILVEMRKIQEKDALVYYKTFMTDSDVIDYVA